jgi:non-ribosomal peptide synthetase component F
VRRAPTAIATSFGTERLTYAQLDEASDRLAGHLRSIGVGRRRAC